VAGRVPTVLVDERIADLAKLQGVAVGSRRYARMFGTTQREWALMTTQERRVERLERHRERWRERARLLARKNRNVSA
jgi:SLT domain-containing protein